MGCTNFNELLVHFLLRVRQNFYRSVPSTFEEMGGQESTMEIR